MTTSMPHSVDRRQALRQGAFFIASVGALSLSGEARAEAQASPIQQCTPPTRLPLQPEFPTSPPDALPEPVRRNLETAMRAAIKVVSPAPRYRGFGAVLVNVDDGRIVAEAKGGDGPGTNHAELNVLRNFGLLHPDGEALHKTVLVTTAEPCPMCATCAIFSRVAGVAYGTSLEFLIGHPPTRMPIRISMPQVVATGPLPNMPVVGGVLHEETDPLFM
ncbi:nucleoside deaminase [Streptacidiphilus anmyonensis]|uniref:nucleoside deaminase n=1 Tax=Streptacidiphilus anmyonensis TaxID=405782 RepID=UPI001364B9C3|nr:nucleoside deaminase [Streptacidiphilus anmyonensis]